jgi:hypothetical protein
MKIVYYKRKNKSTLWSTAHLYFSETIGWEHPLNERLKAVHLTTLRTYHSIDDCISSMIGSCRWGSLHSLWITIRDRRHSNDCSHRYSAWNSTLYRKVILWVSSCFVYFWQEKDEYQQTWGIPHQEQRGGRSINRATITQLSWESLVSKPYGLRELKKALRKPFWDK